MFFLSAGMFLNNGANFSIAVPDDIERQRFGISNNFNWRAATFYFTFKMF